ncbi:22kda glycoprotein [Ophiostoma piceae UAMH 11346]|uniref:22kda glycoprotein n=1 Tax=Ophiostoma piceae (strain UAMH 11346) TaxID=1262450 RepID=S3BXS1_OPHP1|nr:22kda glycoprotein [Ophiostoma piceae UAMH 11346]
MMFSAAAILSAVVAVSANPLSARSDTVFDVTEFEAGCIPHSSQCRYSFGVVQANNGETIPVQCVLLATANGGDLPNVTDAPCTDSSRTFSVVRGTEGLTLTVSQPVSPASNETGSHLLAASDLVTATQPNAEVESYEGPTSFPLVR